MGTAVVAVSELRVIALYIDGAIFGYDPLVSCVPAIAGLYEVCFQLGLAVVVVSVVIGIIGELLEVLAVPVAHSVIPAVSAVSAEAVLEVGVIGPVGIRLNFIIAVGRSHILDRNREPSAIITVIAFRIDREDDHIAGLDVVLLVEGYGLLVGEIGRP